MANKAVFVSDETGKLKILPEKVHLAGGQDTLELVNGTAVDIEWTVEDGAFKKTVQGRKVKKGLGKSGRMKARKQSKKSIYKHWVTVKMSPTSKRRQRGKRLDPEIIIDMR